MFQSCQLFSRFEVLDKLEKKNFTLDRLREMDSKEIGHLIHHVRAGGDVKKAAMEIPVVELEATIQETLRLNPNAPLIPKATNRLCMTKTRMTKPILTLLSAYSKK